MSDRMDHHGSDTNRAQEWMAAHQTELDRQCQTWRAREVGWSWARLVTFCAAGASVYLFRENETVALTMPIPWLFLFALAVWRHRAAARLRDFGERLLQMAAESLTRCGGRLVVIRDGGRPADPAHAASDVPSPIGSGQTTTLGAQELDDLDAYAHPIGLFGLLNRTSTILGARRLRDLIEHPCLSKDAILTRQRLVGWLTENPSARLRIMAAASRLRRQEERLDAFVRLIREARAVTASWFTLGLRAWSLVSAVLIVIALGNADKDFRTWGSALIALLCLNGTLLLRIRRELQEVIEPWRDLRIVAADFLFAAKQAADELNLPDRPEWQPVRSALTSAVRHEVLPALCSRLSWADTGGFLHVLFNLAFFYDLHVAHMVLKRIVPHRDALIASAGALADVEALASLVCFAWEQPVTCVPTLSDDPVILIEQGVHPLIEPEVVVPNDVSLTPAERTWVVTGSNMAGKSTLLRMVGINVLLGQIGSAALCRRMVLQPHRLATDLRIRDDLSKHESYFLAEVRQLRHMVVPIDDGTRLLGLIDEPFRGTNSQERIAASMALVHRFAESPHFFIVATHEQQLVDLAGQTHATNYHFQEDLTDSGPVFDYRLQPGPATRRNALLILGREGYPPDVISRAQDYLRGS